ncbi:hypothetical protein ZWY2020_035622 [Hordeum vulgare]|nr:hypothetical protein ZWY2020_035622 [Hordeum vulgare]
MAGKRKAGDDINRTRHRAARTDYSRRRNCRYIGADCRTYDECSRRRNCPYFAFAGARRADGRDYTLCCLLPRRLFPVRWTWVGSQEIQAYHESMSALFVLAFLGLLPRFLQLAGAGRMVRNSLRRGRRQPLARHTATIPAFAVGYPGSSSQFGGAARGDSLSRIRGADADALAAAGQSSHWECALPYRSMPGYGFFPDEPDRRADRNSQRHWQALACILCGPPPGFGLGAIMRACYGDYRLSGRAWQTPEMGYQLESIPTYVLDLGVKSLDRHPLLRSSSFGRRPTLRRR